jgi:hypothetical protein
MAKYRFVGTCSTIGEELVTRFGQVVELLSTDAETSVYCMITSPYCQRPHSRDLVLPRKNSRSIPMWRFTLWRPLSLPPSVTPHGRRGMPGAKSLQGRPPA